jgi:peptidoglycan hydrolase-like protein with peptidoglycan-binding domain
MPKQYAAQTAPAHKPSPAPHPAAAPAPSGSYAVQSAALKPKAPASPQAKPSPAVSHTSLSWGSTGPRVVELQQQLTAAGYPTPVTGKYFAKTVESVKRYQADHGLLVDGVAGPITQASLSSVAPHTPATGGPTPAPSTELTGSPAMKRGMQGPLVKVLQQRLNHHGASLAVDGDFGKVTEAAVRAFQAANGISTTGVVGKLTAKKLNAEVANAPTHGPAQPGGDYAARGKIAVDAARGQLGVKYVKNAMQPGVAFDCSGLTKYAWAQAGVTLSHYSVAQASETEDVTAADEQPGDLLFFHSPISHVSMVTGKGKHIQAPQTGDVVKEGAYTPSKVVERGRPRI